MLLPPDASLLLAVSGGQDSMALLGLLLGLQRLHHWRLLLWHGDHGWRPESGDQAQELAAWCRGQELTLLHDRCPDALGSEASARSWRYACLERQALVHGCSHVVSGHTASDRAETLLLHLARGSHRRGLGSLQAQRPLNANGDPALLLSRPLLIFTREDTAQICQQLNLPVWLDSSNLDPRFSRNRIRAEVLPVLEQLHPGATRRLGATAERLQLEQACAHEWIALALTWLGEGDAPPRRLHRQRLLQLQQPNQAAVLEHWLREQGTQSCGAGQIAGLVARVQPQQPPGTMHLQGGWKLRWNRSTLELIAPDRPAR